MATPIRPAVAKAIACEIKKPSPSPATSAITPTVSVSVNTTEETWRGLMPSSRYVPNSFLRARTTNRLAYRTKKPKTTATTMLK